MKKSIIVWSLALGSSLGLAGCSGCSTTPPSSERSDETGGPQASQGNVQEGLEQAQQGMDQMLQGLQQLAQSDPSQTKPVDYEVLKGFIPEFSGWERSEVQGQQVTTVVSVSTAGATFTQGDASLELEITDTTLSQLLLAPFSMMTSIGYEERSDAGFKRAITLAGYPGFETWETATGDAEVGLLVANRFIVKADGSGLESTDPAHELVQTVDLSTLATQK